MAVDGHVLPAPLPRDPNLGPREPISSDETPISGREMPISGREARISTTRQPIPCLGMHVSSSTDPTITGVPSAINGKEPSTINVRSTIHGKLPSTIHAKLRSTIKVPSTTSVLSSTRLRLSMRHQADDSWAEMMT